MTRWTSENTEGFTPDDLAELNEAQAQLEANFPGVEPQNLADMLTNVWTADKDARQLERDVTRAINPMTYQPGEKIDMTELDTLCREYFGTHRYQRRLAALIGRSPSTVNAWFTGRTEDVPIWALVLMRALVELKAYRDAKDEARKASESFARVVSRL
jgi:hypothetical protein